MLLNLQMGEIKMKKIICLLLTLTLVLGTLTSISVFAQSGEFKLTFDEWENIENDEAKSVLDPGGQPTGTVEVTNDGKSGKAIIFNQPGDNSKLRFKNAFSKLTVGETYTVSLYAKSATDAQGEISLGLYKNSNPNPVATIAKEKIDNTKWTLISANFVVSENKTDVTKIGIIQSGMQEGDALIGKIMIDDVSVKKAGEQGREDTDTLRIKGITFDKWDNSILQAHLSTGGSQPYENVVLANAESRGDEGMSLKVGGRKNTYDRAKLVRVAKSAAAGNEYKYSAYVKIPNDSNLDKATIVMGVSDLNKTDSVYVVEKEINKKEWTKVEFTYTLKSESEDSIAFEQKREEKEILTEYLIDDVTVECIKRVPTVSYDIDETDGGYIINASLDDYYEEGKTDSKYVQTIVVKYNGTELVAAKMGEKKAFSNETTYPLKDTIKLETQPLKEGEYIKVYSMSDTDENLPILASYKYNPFDPAFNQKVLHLIGDSIVADYTENIAKNPNNITRGWGMYIQEYFDENDIKVNNQAKSGESTKSFLYTNVVQRWLNVKNSLEEGDYVIICLGINDFGSKSPTRKVTVQEYKNNLQTFIDEISKKGGKTILLTLTTTLNSTKEEYAKNGNFRRSMADAMIEVANNNKDNENVYCFDLNQNMLDQMLKLMDQMGYDEFKTAYFADNTHQTEKGARWVLSLIIDLIKNSDCDLKNYIK